MSRRTRQLHEAFLRALGDRVKSHSESSLKPLLIDLDSPVALSLRVYMYTLVGGAGERARREYKVVLRVNNHPVGTYGSFDYSGGRFTTVIGYDVELDVFVLWDAVLHPRFKNGGNLQVRNEVVRRAAASGTAEQIRSLTSGAREVVLACQTADLARALEARIMATGGLEIGECRTFLS